LKRRGFADEEIEKLSSRNFLRFWESVCREVPPVTS
jgi:microsomal dipeptidase-like Zn-dependent dipeptidase